MRVIRIRHVVVFRLSQETIELSELLFFFEDGLVTWGI